MTKWFVKIVSLLYLSGCSTLGLNSPEVDPTSQMVQVAQDSFISYGRVEKKAIKRHENIAVTEPTLFEAPGHVGVLVLPPAESSNYELSLKKLQDWGGHSYNKSLNLHLGKMLGDIQEIQIDIGEKNIDQALVKIEKLRTHYPYLTYLNFLEASCYMLQGKRQLAQSLIKEARKDFPENREGQRLEKYLGTSGEQQ